MIKSPMPAFAVIGGKSPGELEKKLNEWIKKMDEDPSFKIRRTQLAQSGTFLTALINYEIDAEEELFEEERSTK